MCGVAAEPWPRHLDTKPRHQLDTSTPHANSTNSTPLDTPRHPSTPSRLKPCSPVSRCQTRHLDTARHRSTPLDTTRHRSTPPDTSDDPNTAETYRVDPLESQSSKIRVPLWSIGCASLCQTSPPADLLCALMRVAPSRRDSRTDAPALARPVPPHAPPGESSSSPPVAVADESPSTHPPGVERTTSRLALSGTPTRPVPSSEAQ